MSQRSPHVLPSGPKDGINTKISHSGLQGPMNGGYPKSRFVGFSMLLVLYSLGNPLSYDLGKTSSTARASGCSSPRILHVKPGRC